MAGKNTAAFGIYKSNSAAETAVDRLTTAGFSNQDVSVLMADRNNSSVSEPNITRVSTTNYQTKGTFQTAKNIVKHQGIMGLYSGFRLHLRT